MDFLAANHVHIVGLCGHAHRAVIFAIAQLSSLLYFAYCRSVSIPEWAMRCRVREYVWIQRSLLHGRRRSCLSVSKVFIGVPTNYSDDPSFSCPSSSVIFLCHSVRRGLHCVRYLIYRPYFKTNQAIVDSRLRPWWVLPVFVDEQNLVVLWIMR